jgi:hypothetical protein
MSITTYALGNGFLKPQSSSSATRHLNSKEKAKALQCAAYAHLLCQDETSRAVTSFPISWVQI